MLADKNTIETVFIFVTHTFNVKIKREIARISKELEGEYPFFVYYDCAAQDVPVASDAPLISFDYQKISAQFPFRMGGNIIPGNVYLVYTELLKQFPKASNFWIVEYDVRFSGNWRKFLKSFEQSQADLLGCHIRYRYEIPDWIWWRSFQNRLDFATNHNDEPFVRAFLWISRYSRRALGTIRHECIQNGWSGHQEVLVPSLLLRAGLHIEEIGGDSRFTPASRRNRFYSSEYGLSYPSKDGNYGLGGNRFGPTLLFWGLRRNRLYHPVKAKHVSRGRFQLHYKKVGIQKFIRSGLRDVWHFIEQLRKNR